MHAWKLGDEVWACFIRDMRYEPRLLGRVSGVGNLGFTVQLTKPDHAGKRVQRFQHEQDMFWPTEAEGLQWCSERVGPYGPNTTGARGDCARHEPIKK